MITQVHIRNFKALKNIEIELRNLSLFTGVNGMGKSSLTQALLLLRESLRRSNFQFDTGLSIRTSSLNLGTGKDVFYQYAAKDDTLDIFLEFDKKYSLECSFKFTPTYDVFPAKEHKFIEDDRLIPWQNNLTENISYLSLFDNSFQFLRAEHFIPAETYPSSYADVEANKTVGLFGEFAPYYLYVFGDDKLEYENLLQKDVTNNLLRQTGAWLRYISPGISLNVKKLPGSEQIILDYQFDTKIDKTNAYKPVNVGFGINYVLPVIVSLLAARPGKTIVIENPESHLHPRGQSKLGELIARVAQNGVQLIIESHSDHIFNGIRVAVKDVLLDPKNFNCWYFERAINDSEHYSVASEILVDKNGQLNIYPKGFIDEWNIQLRKLL